MQVASKFEIDITKVNQIDEAVDFTIRHNCKAVVVPPDLVAATTLNRGIKDGKFKIITAIDWPRGINYGQNKFMGVDGEAISSDGFEILLTYCQPTMVQEEIKYLNNFFQSYFNVNTTELRYIIGYHMDGRDDKYFTSILESLRGQRNPSMIRTTPLTKIPATKSAPEIHKEILDNIRKYTSAPVKLSGNINTKIITTCNTASYFAVTPQQAQNIVGDLKDINDISN